MVKKKTIPPQIFTLAKDLGLKASDDPAGSVIAHCEKQVAGFIDEMDRCQSLSALLDWVASKVGTIIEEIFCDSDVDLIKNKYVSEGEKVFANLEAELSEDIFGVTFRRQNKKPWERPFVSVIDRRGNKAARSYFTKWHEIAHLLTLTTQMRLVFRRTHVDFGNQDPEERLMDRIAGRLGFYGPIFHKLITADISFDQIDKLRNELCPESSIEASLISFSMNWPAPCMLVKAKLGLNKEEERGLSQISFDFVEKPEPVLRAFSVSVNDAAKNSNCRIFKNMRVPPSSVIHEVFYGDQGYAEAIEDLASWTEKESLVVKIQARRRNSVIEALITPVSH